MSNRQTILRDVADAILGVQLNQIIRVGIDGVDGAGKTYFADELAPLLEESGRPIIRASVDSFHNPKVIRYRLGQTSPMGFFLDSYDYRRLKDLLLDPLSPGGSGRYCTAAFDHRLDSPVATPEGHAATHSILVFDGIFLHRPELRRYWDFSIFLEVAFDTSIARCARRGDGSPDPQAPENARYVDGQKVYLQKCEPHRQATLVINNDDLAAPYIVT